MGDLSLSKGFDVAASGFKDKFEAEWLYDIVWYEEDDHKRLTNIHLAVESEWSKSYSSLKYDFEKLLAARAENKMLMCPCKPEYTQTLFALLREAVKAFNGAKGERYLIAILDSETESSFE